MVKSSSFKLSCIWRALAGCLASISCAEAAINLDKLTACDDIARLYASLQTRQASVQRSCRAPRNALEKALAGRAAKLFASPLCFESAPASFLDGFSCIRMQVGSAELICFRSANMADIQLYQDQYKQKFEALVIQYRNRAAACPVSNGDTDNAVDTTFPPLLSYISRFEFGFINSLGRQRPSDSYVQHGYAATDPSLSSEVPSAIEYVYFLVGAPKPPEEKEKLKKAVGDWIVHVLDGKDTADTLNAAFRKSGTPASATSVSYNLEHRATVVLPQSAKLSLIARLQDAIAMSLEDEGFQQPSDSDIRTATGMSREEFLRGATKSMPYGIAQNPPVKLASAIFLFNQKRPSCVKGGAGVMFAYIFAYEPIPNVGSDYGSINFAVVGLGACARGTIASIRTYTNGLIDEATRQLVTTLESK